MTRQNASSEVLRPYAALFSVALIVAVLARLGLLAMDLTGTISYDYISTSHVPILDVICSILTGSTFVAFLFVAGLALTISLTGVLLYALLFYRRLENADTKARPLCAFFCGWATALCALVCALIVVSGILSAVQIGSMSSKLPGFVALVVALIVFAAFLGTLSAASSLTLCACIARAKQGKGLYRSLIAAAAICGIPVTVLTVGIFSSINTSAINLPATGGWFAAALVVNIAIMAIATTLVKRSDR
ncbi:MAG TPA: hypothetical protein DEB24_06690 [Coriobacteriia bacterium]|nr:hypothetical protein [Coriobacteriia bacterium]